MKVRKELASYLNTAVKIEATFIRQSVSTNKKRFETILLRNIFIVDGKNKISVTDHVWIHSNANFFSNLEQGKKISFIAKVETYTKIKFGEKVTDYCLVHPICINKVEE